MISIQVKHKKDTFKDHISPAYMYGAKTGSVWKMIQVVNKVIKPEKYPTYYIGCGENEWPVCLWYNEDDKTYSLASENKDDVCELAAHVFFVEVVGKLSVNLELE